MATPDFQQLSALIREAQQRAPMSGPARFGDFEDLSRNAKPWTIHDFNRGALLALSRWRDEPDDPQNLYQAKPYLEELMSLAALLSDYWVTLRQAMLFWAFSETLLVRQYRVGYPRPCTGSTSSMEVAWERQNGTWQGMRERLTRIARLTIALQEFELPTESNS